MRGEEEREKREIERDGCVKRRRRKRKRDMCWRRRRRGRRKCELKKEGDE